MRQLDATTSTLCTGAQGSSFTCGRGDFKSMIKSLSAISTEPELELELLSTVWEIPQVATRQRDVVIDYQYFGKQDFWYSSPFYRASEHQKGSMRRT